MPTTRRSSSKRELVNTGRDKRFVRRDTQANSRKATTSAAPWPPTAAAAPRRNPRAAKATAATAAEPARNNFVEQAFQAAFFRIVGARHASPYLRALLRW
ncbi:MAG TPA: hypothetical protein VGP99_01450 [Tepidisphaeraceae bacterium]|nr:hypothetical protein [Tepidisphaeraceae bacterium]